MPDFTYKGPKLHYVEQGEGMPVVFAHGFLMDHLMFAPQFEDLPDNYRCIAWDMRGHGASETPSEPWSVKDTVDDLIHFVSEQCSEPAVVVGMSWGGWVGLRAALARPDLFRGLALINTNAGTHSAEHVALYRSVAEEIISAAEFSSDHIDLAVASLFGPRYIEQNPEAIALHRARMDRMDPLAAAWGLLAICGRDDVRDRLDQLKLPTLVIHSDLDASIPIADARETAGLIAGAELIEIEGVGHTSPLEAPDRVNQALSAFLSRV